MDQISIIRPAPSPAVAAAESAFGSGFDGAVARMVQPGAPRRPIWPCPAVYCGARPGDRPSREIHIPDPRPGPGIKVPTRDLR